MLEKVRQEINDWLLGKSLINKLMTDKVNDFVLIEEQPLPIPIGNKIIYIGSLTLENNYKFWEEYGKILANIGLKFINFDLLSDGENLYKALMLHKKLYKELCKLIKKTILKQQSYYLNNKKERKKIEWTNCSYRYFKKHITIEKLIQICFSIYVYNFDAEKKNLKIILEKMDKKELMEVYMYFWLQNCDGLIGRFSAAHITKPASWSQDGQNKTEMEQGKK